MYIFQKMLEIIENARISRVSKKYQNVYKMLEFLENATISRKMLEYLENARISKNNRNS